MYLTFPVKCNSAGDAEINHNWVLSACRQQQGEEEMEQNSQANQNNVPDKKVKKKRQKKIRRPSRIAFVLMTILASIVLIVNIVVIAVVNPYMGFLNNFLSAAPTDDGAVKATQASADITQRVEEEGIVMLTNNGTLPLTDKKVNVFGAGSVNWSYGGTGSGSGDESKNVNIYDGLANAGFKVNEDLEDFTKKNAQSVQQTGLVGTNFTLSEIASDAYTDDVLTQAKNYSDTALVVISRVGGEGTDIPRDATECGGDKGKSYLELQDSEYALLDLVENNFDKVVVILNCPNTMELGFLDNDKIDASLWVGTTGSTGCNAIGEVLSGDVNPSGRTTDTFAYDLESAPSYYNFGDHDYSNITYANTAMFAGTGDASSGGDNYHYVEYAEGIYVGYRYYETAAADGYIDYDKTVQFPFGYGLSYTTFDEKISDFQESGDKITVSVDVTNTGSTAGKDVVELYVNAPYTQGGIEKAEVVLQDFGKTQSLDPGASETLTFTFNKEDMASYDYTGVKADGGAYVLEEGTYEIRLQSDSHNVIDTRTVDVDRDYIYNDAHDGARSSDKTAATNQFDDVSDGASLTYLSRADWSGTFPKEMAPDAKDASDEIVSRLKTGTVFDTDENTEDIVTARHGLKLSDMAGLDYNDEKWDELMEQVSVNEMKMLIGNGGWQTMAVKSVGKPFMTDCDGPAGINNLMGNMFQGINGNQFTGETVLGQSWNKDLAQEVGKTMGSEFAAYKISGVYGPAVNIHRSPFGGRNYEYFSEDSALSGHMVAAELSGLNDSGVYYYLKHFALNDQETNRDQGGLLTWSNEQAMREIYLKPFEIAVEEGNARGIMSSFNRIGTVPTAESYPLLTTVLRGEWGFNGTVITDCVMSCTTEDVNQSLLAGNDLQLNIIQQGTIKADTPVQRQALRKATKNILYMVANSNAMEITDTSMPGIQKTLIVIDVIIIALFVLYYYRRHRKMKRWKAAQK